ncbi:hypothetical protein BH24PSE2_BH24PSE2_06640 [soil metagenome]
MSEAAQESPEPPQQLTGFMSNDEWDALLTDVSALIATLEELPDEAIRQQIFSLLQGIDAIHREALRRLVRLFKEGVLEQVVTDPAIGTLMELYDLNPLAQPAPGEASRRRKFPDIPIRVVASGPDATSAPVEQPHWVPALPNADALGPGSTEVLALDGRTVLLCRVGEAFFALEGACARDRSPLSDATLSSYTLACPNHPGCLYDVRQGTRIGSSDRLACYPVQSAADGRILVGFGMPFRPNLPSF